MKIITVDLEAKDAPLHFTESLRSTGFAILKNHPIDPNTILKAYKEWEHFFLSAEKNLYLYCQERQDGYFPFHAEDQNHKPMADQKEFFHIYPWGIYPKTMSGATRDLYDQLFHLASLLLQWIEMNTPVEIREKFSMPLTDMIKNSYRTLLRVIYYPFLDGSEKEVIRAAAHEDINLITLLPAATAPGLQIKNIEGNWQEVVCNSGAIIVNAADMLQLCTQGCYRSATHRVIDPEGELTEKSKLSMPLFLYPRDEVFLSETYTANSYRLERLGEAGLL